MTTPPQHHFTDYTKFTLHLLFIDFLFVSYHDLVKPTPPSPPDLPAGLSPRFRACARIACALLRELLPFKPKPTPPVLGDRCPRGLPVERVPRLFYQGRKAALSLRSRKTPYLTAVLAFPPTG